MTYYIQNTNNKYVIDENHNVFSLKSNKFIKPNSGFIHLYNNGYKIVDKPAKFLDAAKKYNKVYSAANLVNSVHIYIFDYTSISILHGLIPEDYTDNDIEEYLSKHNLKTDSVHYIVSQTKLNIINL